MSDTRKTTRLERELWLKAQGVPLPQSPLLPIAAEGLNDTQLRASDHAYLEAWDARDAEIDRLYAVARRDADGPKVPTLRVEPATKATGGSGLDI